MNCVMKQIPLLKTISKIIGHWIKNDGTPNDDGVLSDKDDGSGELDGNEVKKQPLKDKEKEDGSSDLSLVSPLSFKEKINFLLRMSRFDKVCSECTGLGLLSVRAVLMCAF